MTKFPVKLGSAGLMSFAGVLIVFGIVVAINLLGSVLSFRVDLTEDKIYTLSDGTRRIVGELDTPVVLRFYVSDDMSSLPQEFKNMSRRVEDLLVEYKKASDGMVRVEKFLVKQDSDEEDSAALDGIRPSGGGPLGMGDPVFFGISVSCLDQRIAMPFVPARPETLLEYDLSRAISQVVNPEKPRVAIMTSLELGGGFDPQNFQAGPKPAWVFYNELGQDYDVSLIGTDVEEIVVDVAGSGGENATRSPDVLLVIHPYDIGPAGEYAIDQYLLGGGKVVALLDPMFFSARFLSQAAPGPMMPPPTIEPVSTFSSLLGAWGVEFDSTRVVADMQYRTPLRGGIVSPAILTLGEEAINAEDPVTAQLQDVALIFTGGFVVDAKEGTSAENLLSSSQFNELILPAEAEPGPEFQKLLDEFSPSGVVRAYAVRLAGEFTTAFPDGNPNPPEAGEEGGDEAKDAGNETKGEKKSESLKGSAAPGAVVLFGDADFVYDQFAVQQQNMLGQRFIIPLNGNLSLLQNTVEQLAGDANLINVRSRSAVRRPFTKINEMEAAAEQKFSAKIQELENDVRETQGRLNELQEGKDENQKFVLSPEQQAEIESVNKRVAEKNRELREVRKDLRKDIDSMISRLKAVNIAAMPAAVIIVGLGLAAARRSKRAAR